MALGSGASASGSGSVAIGSNSTDGGRDDVVSFGSEFNRRSLINIDGVSAAGRVEAGSLGVSGNASVDGRLTSNGIDNRGGGITNAGLITGVTATSTDAVNGSQLYAVRNTAEQALNLANQQGTQVQQITNQVTQNTQQITQHTEQIAQHTEQITQHTQQIAQQAVQIQAMVNGQLGVCTVNGSALQCSVQGQAPARAVGAGAAAVGNGAQAVGEGAVAMGRNAKALAAGALALGDGSSASARNAVALGQGSVADRPDSVSVGNAATGYQRQITNVAPGVAATDAVNLAQMERAVAVSYGQAREFAARGVAQAMAMPSIPMLAPGRKWLGAAVGHYAGQSALGVAFAYQVDERWSVGAGLTAAAGNGAQLGGRLQAGYQW